MLDFKILSWIAIILSSLSIMFSLPMICLYLFYQPLKTFPGRLMLGISCSNFFINVNYLITCSYFTSEGSFLDGLTCEILGFCMNFFEVFNAFLILTISGCLYVSICLNMDPDIHERTIWRSLVIASTFLSIIPLTQNDFGNSDQIQCWICNNETALWTFYMPILLIFVCILVFLFKCYQFLGNDFKKTAFLFILPLVFLTAYILPISRRVVVLFDEDNGSLNSLYYLSYSLFLSKGIFDTLAYCYLNNFLKQKISNYFHCRASEKLEENNSNLETIINN